MMALDESYQLTKSASIFEALNEGKVEKVIDILYIDIKNSLKNKSDYSDYNLRCETIKIINENEKQTKEIFKRYPNPRFPKDKSMD